MQKGKIISLLPERLPEVDYFLANVERQPVFLDSTIKYKAYLFSAAEPVLMCNSPFFTK